MCSQLRRARVLAVSVLVVATCSIPAVAEQCSPWHWANPSPQGNDLQAVASGGGVYVAVGDYGTIVRSIDAEHWTSVRSQVETDLHGVAWGANRFVTVGDQGTVLISDQGKLWTPVDSGTARDLMDVTWSGFEFVAVSNQYDVVTSGDGSHWTRFESGVVDLRAVTWAGSTYVAVGHGQILTSVDAEIWAVTSSPDWGWLYDVAADEDGFVVAVGESGKIWLSEDAATWVEQDSGTSRDIWSVVWDFQRWVAVGRSGLVLSSQDGEVWERWPTDAGRALLGVVWGEAGFAAVGERGTILTSEFAREWVMWSTETVDDDLVELTWGDYGYLAISGVISKAGRTAAYWSRNGMSWVEDVIPTDGPLRSAACMWGRCVVVGEGLAALTTDGGTWTLIDLSGVDLYGATASQYGFVAVGGAVSGVAVMASPDGVSWAFRSPAVGGTLFDVCAGDQRMAAVGSSGTILVSEDGESWVQRTSGVTDTLHAVTWTGRGFVAVGNRETILTSDNGDTWVVRTLTPAGAAVKTARRALVDVEGGGPIAVAIADDGSIITSTDDVVWEVADSLTPRPLGAVAWSGRQYLAVGDQGDVLQAVCPYQIRVPGGRIP